MQKSLLLTTLFFSSIILFGLTSSELSAMPNLSGSKLAKILQGTIIQTMNSRGYTYLQVEESGVRKWVAIPETTIQVGSRISYYDGDVMENFPSKSLNRTFDKIIFSKGLASDKELANTKDTNDSFASAVQKENSTQQAVQVESSGGSNSAIVPMQEVSIEKMAGENSYSVEEVFAKAKELNGKKIIIHGKVVKFNANIMGRNWVHIQDGSGNPMVNTHDLVVTTTENVALGSTITLEGVVAHNKDFGAGYHYVVLVEEGVLKK